MMSELDPAARVAAIRERLEKFDTWRAGAFPGAKPGDDDGCGLIVTTVGDLRAVLARCDALEADHDAYRRCVRAMRANRHHLARCVTCGIGGLACATGDAARAEEQAAIAALPVEVV